MGKQKKEVRKSPIARRRSVVLNKSKSERDHQMQKVVTTPSADVDVVNNFGVAYEDETYSTRNDILRTTFNGSVKDRKIPLRLIQFWNP